jgi:hypothetical protein
MCYVALRVQVRACYVAQSANFGRLKRFDSLLLLPTMNHHHIIMITLQTQQNMWQQHE